MEEFGYKFFVFFYQNGQDLTAYRKIVYNK